MCGSLESLPDNEKVVKQKVALQWRNTISWVTFCGEGQKIIMYRIATHWFKSWRHSVNISFRSTKIQFYFLLTNVNCCTFYNHEITLTKNRAHCSYALYKQMNILDRSMIIVNAHLYHSSARSEIRLCDYRYFVALQLYIIIHRFSSPCASQVMTVRRYRNPIIIIVIIIIIHSR